MSHNKKDNLGRILVVLGLRLSKKYSYYLRPWAKFRVLAALALWRRGKVSQIIFSGGQVNKKIQSTEAQAMKRYFIDSLRENFVKEKKSREEITRIMSEAEKSIILENKSTNTIENILFLIDLLSSLKINQDDQSQIAILSSEFHLPRIQKILKLLKLNFLLVPDRSQFTKDQIAKYNRSLKTSGYQILLKNEKKFSQKLEKIKINQNHRLLVN